MAEHQALANARWVIEQEEFERVLRAPERHAFRRLWAALVLAQDVATFEALLDGQRVPVDRLNREWLDRFGLAPVDTPLSRGWRPSPEERPPITQEVRA